MLCLAAVHLFTILVNTSFECRCCEEPADTLLWVLLQEHLQFPVGDVAHCVVLSHRHVLQPPAQRSSSLCARSHHLIGVLKRVQLHYCCSDRISDS